MFACRTIARRTLFRSSRPAALLRVVAGMVLVMCLLVVGHGLAHDPLHREHPTCAVCELLQVWQTPPPPATEPAAAPWLTAFAPAAHADAPLTEAALRRFPARGPPRV